MNPKKHGKIDNKEKDAIKNRRRVALNKMALGEMELGIEKMSGKGGIMIGAAIIPIFFFQHALSCMEIIIAVGPFGRFGSEATKPDHFYFIFEMWV